MMNPTTDIYVSRHAVIYFAGRELCARWEQTARVTHHHVYMGGLFAKTERENRSQGGVPQR